MGTYIHATAVVIGEQGVLIRGPSGSGKTTLARTMIARATEAGRFAALVGDDRVALTAAHGRLILRPHPVVAGSIELRGLGIMPMAHEPAVRLALVVECAAAIERMPASQRITLAGVEVAYLMVAAHAADGADSVLAALALG